MMRPRPSEQPSEECERAQGKGRAPCFTGSASRSRSRSSPDPKPGPGELVLRVKSCGICGSDLHAASLPPGLPAGTVMGHEFAGEVVEVGSDAARELEGRRPRVRVPVRSAAASAAPCLAGDIILCSTLRGTGLGQIPGAYSEYVLVGGNESLRLPSGVSFREGALVEPLAVGLHAVNQARLQPGERVMVIGAGPDRARRHGVGALLRRARGRRERARAGPHRARAEVRRDRGRRRVEGRPRHGVPARDRRPARRDLRVRRRARASCSSASAWRKVRGRVVVVGVCMQPDTIFPVMGIIKEVELRFVVAYHRRDLELASTCSTAAASRAAT